VLVMERGAQVSLGLGGSEQRGRKGRGSVWDVGDAIRGISGAGEQFSTRKCAGGAGQVD
jgi:hypothetical protein